MAFVAAIARRRITCYAEALGTQGSARLAQTVPPDISLDNFRYYIERKQALLAGDFAKL